MNREVWRPVAGFEDSYEVSDLARIKSLQRTVDRSDGRQARLPGRIMKTRTIKFGYLTVALSRDGVEHCKLVSRLMLEAFVGPCPGPWYDACHGDGDPTNNSLANLRWDTRVGNYNDRRKHGTANTGSRNHKAKLTEGDIPEIRRMLAEGLTGRQIGDRFGVTSFTINGIRRGALWRHVP